MNIQKTLNFTTEYKTLMIPGEKNQDRLLVGGSKKIDLLAIADGAGDTKEGGFAAECLLKALDETSGHLPVEVIKHHFEKIHKNALQLLDNDLRNEDKKALAAYAIVFILPNSTIKSCSMGDVMFVVFRNSKPVFNTTEYVREDHWIQKGLMVDYDEDGFNDIIVEEYTLEDNDLIIGASDGLWDNRRPEELSEFVDFNSPVSEIIRKLGDIPHDRKGYQDDRGIIVYRYHS